MMRLSARFKDSPLAPDRVFNQLAAGALYPHASTCTEPLLKDYVQSSMDVVTG